MSVHIDKRGDVEIFSYPMPELPALQSGPAEEIRFHFPEGIAYLYHRTERMPLLVMTEIEGNGIEEITQRTTVCEDLYPSVADHYLLCQQIVCELLPDIFRGIRSVCRQLQVVPVPEIEEVKPVPAQPAHSQVQGVQLIQIQVEQKNSIPEEMLFWG